MPMHASSKAHLRDLKKTFKDNIVNHCTVILQCLKNTI